MTWRRRGKPGRPWPPPMEPVDHLPPVPTRPDPGIPERRTDWLGRPWSQADHDAQDFIDSEREARAQEREDRFAFERQLAYERRQQDAARAELLTELEHEVVDELGRIAGKLRRICGDGTSREGDVSEWVDKIHQLQVLVMAQAAARAYPDRYRLLGGTVAKPGDTE